jgi:integrase
MNYPTTESKNGLIYHIAEGVKIIPRNDGYWILDAYQKGERLRRAFERGEEGLRKAIQTAELYVAKLGLRRSGMEEKFITVSQVTEEWLKANRSRWAYGTLERYSSLARDFLLPRFGEMPIKKIDRNQVRDLLVDTLAIRSAKSVEVFYAVLSGIFGEAIERGYVESNPCHGLLKKILPPKRKRNQSTPDPFSSADLERLLDAAWEHLSEPVPLVLETLAYTGMRLGECLAMRWNHYDALNRQYMISEAVRHKRYDVPKTGKRLIDIPDFLADKLERHIKELRKAALREGKEVNFLFPGITPRIVQNAMKRACHAAKLRVRSPHDLRHTYATLLLMGNVSPAYVQKQLGHHSITMTVDIYGHWIPGEGKGKEHLNETFGRKTVRISLKLKGSPFDEKDE